MSRRPLSEIENLDLTITALRDAIRGASNNTLSDIVTQIIAEQQRDIASWGGTSLTGSDITSNIQNLDLAITGLRDALRGVNNDTITDIVNSVTSNQPRDIASWGGTTLTGSDITSNIQNLDLAITGLRDALRGIDDRTITELFDRLSGNGSIQIVDSGGTAADITTNNGLKIDNAEREAESLTVAAVKDISGGVTQALDNYSRWTVYASAAGAIDITFDLSPNNATTWFTLPESPIVISSSSDKKAIEMGYDATDVRFTGSNITEVIIIIRGVF